MADRPAPAERLAGRLRLFRNATSLGGVESLVEWRRKYDESISPHLLRMSVGLEAEVDLRADITRAVLEMVQQPPPPPPPPASGSSGAASLAIDDAMH